MEGMERYKSGLIENDEDSDGNRIKIITVPKHGNNRIDCITKGSEMACSLVTIEKERRKRNYQGEPWKTIEHKEFIGTFNAFKIDVGYENDAGSSPVVSFTAGSISITPKWSPMACKTTTGSNKSLECKSVKDS
jgi:hypothetical protein